MAKLICLKCPSCGADIDVTDNVERFRCEFCKSNIKVQHSTDGSSHLGVIEVLKIVQTGVDKTASELAIVRLKKELEEIYRQRKDPELDPKIISLKQDINSLQVIYDDLDSIPMPNYVILLIAFGIITGILSFLFTIFKHFGATVISVGLCITSIITGVKNYKKFRRIANLQIEETINKISAKAQELEQQYFIINELEEKIANDKIFELKKHQDIVSENQV